MVKFYSFLTLALLGLSACPLPAYAIVIAAGNPNSNAVSFGQSVDGINLAGVVAIISSDGGCSGSLLSDGFSILTAGHCVTTAFGAPVATNITVFFRNASGFTAESVSNVQVDPSYTGDSTQGGDLAVLTLSQAAPSTAVGYSLFAGSLPVSTPLVIAGYGYGGTGSTGADSATYPFGTLRAGENEYEGDGQEIFGWSSSLAIGQFVDSALASTNVLGVADPYIASDEVDISHGDSGGPTFYNGQLVGVHDLGICVSAANPADCAVPPAENASNNSYFGDLFADNSVAANLNFIENAEIPEPGTAALLLCGLLFSLQLRRRKAGNSR